MRRALQIAACGRGNTSPNPMVGAVIVCGNRIIGEGYHRQVGHAHAEVNAIASVKDRSLLKDSTIYVTLEPCSHYGKTPPCADLIIRSGIPRVVVGCADPFPKVSGRGIEMMRNAGIEVTVGVLEKECMSLNEKFFTAHTLKRPYVTLKWAQSKDGYLDVERPQGAPPYRFSTTLSSLLVHRLRSLSDAIMVGSGTVKSDHPKLNVRNWCGRDPLRFVVDRRGTVSGGREPLELEEAVYITGDPDLEVGSLLSMLYEDYGITSVLVEGGAKLLQSFIDSNLWDMARVEIAPVLLGSKGTAKIRFDVDNLSELMKINTNTIITLKRPLTEV